MSDSAVRSSSAGVSIHVIILNCDFGIAEGLTADAHLAEQFDVVGSVQHVVCGKVLQNNAYLG
jgi:hypothetical protein